MELIVVITIILILSAVALPTVRFALGHRQASEAARILQGALVGARDAAIHTNAPSGVRLLWDASFPPHWLDPADGDDDAADAAYLAANPGLLGQIDPRRPIASSRIVPIGPAPQYSDGLCSVYPGADYPFAIRNGQPWLVLEAAVYDAHGLPLAPTSWMWNVRVGDKVQVQNAGPWYTVVGPMAVGPAKGNAEMFVNVGPPGTTLLTRQIQGPKGPLVSTPDFLLLVNGRDDNGNGWTDEGLAGPEQERWVGSIGMANVLNVAYTISRRPIPLPNAREIALPSDVVIDLTNWATTRERSRLPAPSPLVNYLDIVLNPDGTLLPTTASSNFNAVGMDGAFIHLWLSERGDMATTSIDPTTLAVTSVLKSPVGEWRLLTLFAKSGRLGIVENPDPATAFAVAQQGER